MGVGKRGEQQLALWAAEHGIVCTRPDDDVNGWDYLLEYPIMYECQEGSVSLDKIPNQIRCLIQVKSTKSLRRSVRISLINALRFAKTNMPCFFLFFCYNDSGLCQIRLVHFDKDYISRALCSARMHSLVRKKGKTSSKNFIVTCGASSELKLDSSCVFDKIFDTIKDMKSYSDDKSMIIEGAGYEEHGISGKFVLSANESYNDPVDMFIDLSLGIINKIEIKNMAIYDCRFGIEDPSPVHFSESGVIEIETYAMGEVKLVCKNSRYLRSMSYKTGIYAPDGLDFNKERERYRFRVGDELMWFEIYASQTDRQPRNSFVVPDFDSEFDFHRIRIHMELLNMILDARDEDSFVDISVFFRGDLVGTVRLTPSSDCLNSSEYIIRKSKVFFKILNDAGFCGDGVKISLNDIYNNRDSIHKISKSIEPISLDFYIGINKIAQKLGSEFHLIYPVVMFVNDIFIVSCVSADVVYGKIDGKFCLKVESYSVIDNRCLDGDILSEFDIEGYISEMVFESSSKRTFLRIIPAVLAEKSRALPLNLP